MIRQFGESGYLDAIPGEALGVLGHAEFFEPVRNLLHVGHRDPSGPDRVFHHGNREFTPIRPRYHASQYKVPAGTDLAPSIDVWVTGPSPNPAIPIAK